MSDYLITDTLSESRKEAISRAVIVARVLTHFDHRFREAEAEEQADVREVFNKSITDLLEWTADAVDQAAPLIDAAFACQSKCCVQASKLGPKGLYDLLAKQESANDPVSLSLCGTGRGILRFGTMGDLRSDWKLKRWGDAASHPEKASEILSNSDLSNIPSWSSRAFELIDEEFRGARRYRTASRRKEDLLESMRSLDLDFSGTTPTFTAEHPSGTTLRHVDTSRVSQAAWAQELENFRYP